MQQRTKRVETENAKLRRSLHEAVAVWKDDKQVTGMSISTFVFCENKTL